MKDRLIEIGIVLGEGLGGVVIAHLLLTKFGINTETVESRLVGMMYLLGGLTGIVCGFLTLHAMGRQVE